MMMAGRSLRLALVAVLFTLGCTASALQPTDAPKPAIPDLPKPGIPDLPIVVTGQSNAVNLFSSGAFPALYPKAICAGCLGNMPISAWDGGTDLWQQLEAALRQPLAALVQWQGETDYNLGNRHWAADERAFLGRVRGANKNPNLLVVLVEIVPFGDNGFIRAAQEQVAASDPNVVLVKMDGIQTADDVHLAILPGQNGYVTAAQRILEAIAARYRP